MQKSKGVAFFGVAIIVLGVYNLIGIGNYRQFALMFKGLSNLVSISAYVFTILYGVCGIYCGIKILRLEDWARRAIIWLTVVSVISGLGLNRPVMSNFREMLFSGQLGVEPDMMSPVYRYAIAFTALVTLFEMSVIFFFTRPGVVKQFRPESS